MAETTTNTQETTSRGAITWDEFTRRYVVVRLADTGLYAIQVDNEIQPRRYATYELASSSAVDLAHMRHGWIIVPAPQGDYQPY